ncbi:MAG: energy transducer TonB [Paludibacteraceae bacterium]|nr:energy transducer TonB [Paludibacteraceae bacterium]
MQLKKSLKASLEDKKLVYTLMGFVLVLSICFVAFEWTAKPTVYVDNNDADDGYEEEIVQQTVQEEELPPEEEIIEEVIEEIQQNIDELVVVDDDVETQEIDLQTQDEEIELIVEKPAEVEVEEEEEEQIFTIVEKNPEFPGGQQAMLRYVAENIKYPVIAQENGVQGRVVCQFVVEKDGKPSNIKVVRSSGDDSLDKEAVRVISSMPKWKPGMQQGKPVRVTFTLPVAFRLQ